VLVGVVTVAPPAFYARASIRYGDPSMSSGTKRPLPPAFCYTQRRKTAQSSQMLPARALMPCRAHAIGGMI